MFCLTSLLRENTYLIKDGTNFKPRLIYQHIMMLGLLREIAYFITNLYCLLCWIKEGTNLITYISKNLFCLLDFLQENANFITYYLLPFTCFLRFDKGGRLLP